MKKTIALAIISSVCAFQVLAQDEEHPEKHEDKGGEPKNEISIDISILFNFSKSSSGILYKRLIGKHLSLRARFGGAYRTDSEDIDATTTRKTINMGFTGGVGIEHSHNIHKFEFIYGLDFLAKELEDKIITTGDPTIDRTTIGYGVAPFIGINYHPTETIVFGIEPEAFVGASNRKVKNGPEVETSHESEILLIEGVAFYIGLKF